MILTENYSVSFKDNSKWKIPVSKTPKDRDSRDYRCIFKSYWRNKTAIWFSLMSTLEISEISNSEKTEMNWKSNISTVCFSILMKMLSAKHRLTSFKFLLCVWIQASLWQQVGNQQLKVLLSNFLCTPMHGECLNISGKIVDEGLFSYIFWSGSRW